MTDKFKVGDRVKFKEKVKIDENFKKHCDEIDLDLNQIYEIGGILEDLDRIIIYLLPYISSFKCSCFELVERKIGDTWVKAEDLDKMEEENKHSRRITIDKDGTKSCEIKTCLICHNLFKNEDCFISNTICKDCKLKENKMKYGKCINCGEKTNSSMSHFDLNCCGLCWNKGLHDKNTGTKTMEHTADLKEEFKVDKLGYYEARNGKKFECLHISKGELICPCTFICEEEDLVIRTKINGMRYEQMTDNDLIKYLGPEFPKEPRVFEFEAMVYSITSVCVNQLVLSNFSHDFMDMLEENFPLQTRPLKYKITLKEILE